jgi:hypothetical protein
MRTTVLAISIALALGAGAANAQTTVTDDLNQLRADIQADRQAVVANNLGLTDGEGTTFWPLYREYRNALAPVGDRMTKLIMDYAKNWEAVSDTQATAMVDEFLSIQKQQLKVKEQYVGKFRKALPPKKVARFFQIENKLDVVVAVGLAANIPLVP